MDRREIALSAGIGVTAGLVARGLFVVLPPPWDTLANTSALWGLVGAAAAVTTRSGGRAAVGAGSLSLLTMVLTFAATDGTTTGRDLALWLVVGVAAGASFGLAGSMAPATGATGLISGVLVGEAVYGLVLIGGPQWWLELAIGVLVAATARRPPVAAAISAALTVALFGAYLLYDAIAAA